MFRIAAFATLVALLHPAFALAQMTTGPAPLATLQPQLPHQALQYRWSQVQSRVSQVHAAQLQARNEMLGALTPAHRSLLAQIAGQLAVSPNPDGASAARQLDAVLSPAESHAIVTIDQNFSKAMLAAMERDMPVPLPQHRSFGGFGADQRAGQILLRSAAMAMLPMPNMIFGTTGR